MLTFMFSYTRHLYAKYRLHINCVTVDREKKTEDSVEGELKLVFTNGFKGEFYKQFTGELSVSIYRQLRKTFSHYLQTV